MQSIVILGYKCKIRCHNAMRDATMITNCKLNLPEKIGNHINNFFMQSRKSHNFYFNLITTIGGIICYLRIQMQNQMAKCVTRLQRHLWSQSVNWIYLRRLVTTSIIISCNLGNLIILSPFFSIFSIFDNFLQFLKMWKFKPFFTWEDW